MAHLGCLWAGLQSCLSSGTRCDKNTTSRLLFFFRVFWGCILKVLSHDFWSLNMCMAWLYPGTHYVPPAVLEYTLSYKHFNYLLLILLFMVQVVTDNKLSFFARWLPIKLDFWDAWSVWSALQSFKVNK